MLKIKILKTKFRKDEILKRLPNFIVRLIIKIVYFKRLLFIKYPKIIVIEPTNYCNYNCNICPISHMKRKRGYMDLKLYRKIIDESSALGIKTVHLYMYGEPLLHPRLDKMINYARSKDMEVWFNTNGLLLNKNICKRLIKSGLTGIRFSFHGPTKEVYERIHGTDKFNEVINKIRELKRIRDEMKSKTPFIRVECIRSDIGIDKINNIFEIFRGYVDEIKLTECNWCCNYSKENHALIKPLKRTTPCFYLLESLVVLWNGDVTVCCADFDGILSIGNIKENGLRELLNSNKLRNYRIMHLRGKYMPFCSYCMDSIALLNIKRKYPLEIQNK